MKKFHMNTEITETCRDILTSMPVLWYLHISWKKMYCKCLQSFCNWKHS